MGLRIEVYSLLIGERNLNKLICGKPEIFSARGIPVFRRALYTAVLLFCCFVQTKWYYMERLEGALSTYKPRAEGVREATESTAVALS